MASTPKKLEFIGLAKIWGMLRKFSNQIILACLSPFRTLFISCKLIAKFSGYDICLDTNALGVLIRL